MPNDERESPIDSGGSTGQKRKQWFRLNRGGAGWHPSSWQGWLIVVVVVAAIVTVVVLFRTGAL